MEWGDILKNFGAELRGYLKNLRAWWCLTDFEYYILVTDDDELASLFEPYLPANVVVLTPSRLQKRGVRPNKAKNSLQHLEKIAGKKISLTLDALEYSKGKIISKFAPLRENLVSQVDLLAQHESGLSRKTSLKLYCVDPVFYQFMRWHPESFKVFGGIAGEVLKLIVELIEENAQKEGCKCVLIGTN